MFYRPSKLLSGLIILVQVKSRGCASTSLRLMILVKFNYTFILSLRLILSFKCLRSAVGCWAMALKYFTNFSCRLSFRRPMTASFPVRDFHTNFFFTFFFFFGVVAEQKLTLAMQSTCCWMRFLVTNLRDTVHIGKHMRAHTQQLFHYQVSAVE